MAARGWRAGVAVMLVLLAVVAGLAACGGGDRASGPDRSGRSSRAHPFDVVGGVPGDPLLVAAGRGTGAQLWNSDEIGSDEPYTVLARDGHGGDDPKRALVSISGYTGYEGGLRQASSGYQDPRTRELRFDGHDAYFVPNGPLGADLVAAIAGPRALHVVRPGATQAELIDLARRAVVPSGHHRAPRVPDPPSGWHVVGSVDAGLQGFEGGNLSFEGSPSGAPGPKGAYVMQWRLDDGLDRREVLTVATLPGTEGDPEALTSGGTGWSEDLVIRRPTVQGRPAVMLRGTGSYDGAGRRLVAYVAEDGDLVVVTAPADHLTDAQLLAVAGRVQPTTDARWKATLDATGGGPTLRATAGAVEVQRGETAGVRWLLQASPRSDQEAGMAGSCPAGGGTCVEGPSGPDAGSVVDRCLRVVGVADGVCPASGQTPSATSLQQPGQRPPDLVAVGREAQTVLGHHFPAFSVVQTWDPAARTVRVLTATGPVDQPLVPVEGSSSKAAMVVATPDSAVTTCAVEPGLPPPSPASGAPHPAVRILDEQGRVISCLGADR